MIDLKELGIGQEELQGRVVKMICDRVLTRGSVDDEGCEYRVESEFSQNVENAVKEKIDEAVAQIADKHIKPGVVDHIEKLTLQKTSEWGEKKGEPVTFVEYIIERAHEYMLEKVDYEGKGKGESGGYSWSGKQTRIAYAIHQHLQYQIEGAMKQILADANGKITGGLTEACKVKLEEISKQLKVKVDLGR